MNNLFALSQTFPLNTPSASSSTLLSALAAAAAPQPALSLPWVAVRQRFQQFNNNLVLKPTQFLDGFTKRKGVVSCLNRRYYDSASETDNSFLVGSWSKDTAVRPPRDVDLYFLLPPEVHARFQTYGAGRQSALLQEVKGALQATYPDTDMSGDGQVVVVRFGSYNVDVLPAFQLTNGKYWICHTRDGGFYEETNPWAEVTHLETIDKANNGNLRPLIRMLKAWQVCCSVPMKSFQLELLAADFIARSPWRFHDYFWFDWITRDFFAYLYHCANSTVVVPGTLEVVALGDAWQSRAQTAYSRAVIRRR